MKVVHILLVEDDSMDIMDIRRTLDKMRILYRLTIARNGMEALALLKRHSETPGEKLPDVALIDSNIPEMNGLELLRAIRSTDEWKHLKCFLITSSKEGLDRTATKHLSISGNIVKPFKINNPGSIDSFNLIIDLMNMKD